FSYTFECSHPFQAGSDYRARWKKAETRLLIVTQEVGSDKRNECELKTTLDDVVYGVRNGQLVGYTPEQFEQVQSAAKLLREEAHPSDTDSAHYPLSITLLQVDWRDGAAGGVIGSGRGNVRGSSIASFDFSAL